MLPKEKVTDSDLPGKAFTKDCDVVQALLQSEEYISIRQDRELFDYYYKETSDGSTGWVQYYDEPDKKVKYKYEDGCNLVSCMSECIVDAPMEHVLCLFAEIDVFKDWFPQVTGAKLIKKLTDYKGLYSC